MSFINVVTGLRDGRLDQILVLRIEGGNDFFISVTGTYVPSGFGLSLEHLAIRPKPGSVTPTNKPVDLLPRSKTEQLPVRLRDDDKGAESRDLKRCVSTTGRAMSPFVSASHVGPYTNLVAGPGRELLPAQLSRMLEFLWADNRLRTPGLFVDDLRALRAQGDLVGSPIPAVGQHSLQHVLVAPSVQRERLGDLQLPVGLL